MKPIRRHWLEQLIPRDLPPEAVTLLAVRTTAIALEFLGGLALAHVFHASAFGEYVFVMSCVAVIVVPAAAGLDRLVVREIAACAAHDDWPRAKGLLQHSSWVVMTTSITLAAGFSVGADRAANLLGPEMVRPFQFGMILVPIIAIARLRQGALQGLGKVVAGQMPEAIVQPTTVIALTLGVGVMVMIPRSGQAALTIQLVASGLACALGVILLRRSMPPELASAVPTHDRRQWTRSGLHFTWLVTMTALLTHADVILLGLIQGPSGTGPYRVASQLAMFVGLPLTAVSTALAPRFASLFARNQASELQARATAAARTIVLLAAGIALVIACFGRYILGLFGAEFVEAYLPALILSGAYLAHSAMATSGYLLLMSGHERLVMIVFTGGAILTVASSVLLIPHYGNLGAAIGTSLSLILVSTSCALLAWLKLGINATALAARLPNEGI